MSGQLNEQQAREFVIKTILTGDKKKIEKVINRYREVYGKAQGKDQNDIVREAEQIFDSKEV